MEYKDIINLIKLIQKTNLSEFKLKEGDFEIVIRTENYLKSKPQEVRHVAAPADFTPPPILRPEHQPAANTTSIGAASTSSGDSHTEASKGDLLEIKSPIVGTFYRAPSPDKDPYVKVGDVISSGDVVCIVEAMKLFNEIESDISGKIVKVMVDDATPVEYDQVLFLVDPHG